MPTVDVRKYGDTVRDQSKSSVEEIRKIMRAWVGATDLAYERVRTELKDLETRNRAQIEKLQKRAKKLHREEVRKQVMETYEDLAKRGEKVIQDLRTRPQTRLVFARAEKTLKHAEEKLHDAEAKVEDARAPRHRPGPQGRPQACGEQGASQPVTAHADPRPARPHGRCLWGLATFPHRNAAHSPAAPGPPPWPAALARRPGPPPWPAATWLTAVSFAPSGLPPGPPFMIVVGFRQM